MAGETETQRNVRPTHPIPALSVVLCSQVIVSKDSKAIGRLSNPSVRLNQDQASVAFSGLVWQPVGGDKAERQLCISTDSFSSSSLRLQIFSRLHRAFPASFVFVGIECVAAIEQHRQREEYRASQHRKFIAATGTEPVAKSQCQQKLHHYEFVRGGQNPMHGEEQAEE